MQPIRINNSHVFPGADLLNVQSWFNFQNPVHSKLRVFIQPLSSRFLDFKIIILVNSQHKCNSDS